MARRGIQLVNVQWLGKTFAATANAQATPKRNALITPKIAIVRQVIPRTGTPLLPLPPVVPIEAQLPRAQTAQATLSAPLLVRHTMGTVAPIAILPVVALIPLLLPPLRTKGLPQAIGHYMKSRNAIYPRYLYSVLPALTIVSVNNPAGFTPILASDVARFKPDILMIQESHYKHARLLRGNPRSSRLQEKYVFALVSHYNAIYVFNKNLTLQSHEIQRWYARMTISTPLNLGEDNNPNQSLTIQSLYTPSQDTNRRTFFLQDEGNLQKIPTSTESPPCILAGDFNDYPNPELDRIVYQEINRPKEKARIWHPLIAPLLHDAALTDAFRLLHPITPTISRPRIENGTPMTGTRIDHTFVSLTLRDNIAECYYTACPDSDHFYMITVIRSNQTIPTGPGNWHLHPGVIMHPQFRDYMTKYSTELLQGMPSYLRAFSMSDWE
jgi:exonuclease III